LDAATWSAAARRSFPFAVAGLREPQAVNRERKAASSRSTPHSVPKIYRKIFFTAAEKVLLRLSYAVKAVLLAVHLHDNT
jgi:hypothetical protein